MFTVRYQQYFGKEKLSTVLFKINLYKVFLVYFTQIKDVKTHEKEDRMESFFLAETAKYLYLLFDEDNFIHQNNGSVNSQMSPSCFAGSAGYIFNTEAHPIDIGAIHCCSSSRLTHVPEELRIQQLFGIKTKGSSRTKEETRTFTGDYTCKARPFEKKLSMFGAFIEELLSGKT